jgi:hypothetical protein
MQIVIGVWVGLAGILACLAGLSSMRRVSRLRRSGTTAWAMVVRSTEHRTAVQFTLDDGRVVEQPCAEPTRGRALKAGQKILVWYDPADPADVLVFGRYSRRADRLFVAGGLLLVAIGTTIAVVAH